MVTPYSSPTRIRRRKISCPSMLVASSPNISSRIGLCRTTLNERSHARSSQLQRLARARDDAARSSANIFSVRRRRNGLPHRGGGHSCRRSCRRFFPASAVGIMGRRRGAPHQVGQLRGLASQRPALRGRADVPTVAECGFPVRGRDLGDVCGQRSQDRVVEMRADLQNTVAENDLRARMPRWIRSRRASHRKDALIARSSRMHAWKVTGAKAE